jgi:hypothetical protein
MIRSSVNLDCFISASLKVTDSTHFWWKFRGSGQELSIGSVTSATGGTAVLDLDGSVTFTPNAEFNGAADFTIRWRTAPTPATPRP